MARGLTLSPKHGANCSVVICPICKKDTSLVMFGRLKGDAKAPMQVEGDLCDDCKKKYVTVIEVESETNRKPTGRCVYVPVEDVKIQCKDNIALMSTEDFVKTFIDNAKV